MVELLKNNTMLFRSEDELYIIERYIRLDSVEYTRLKAESEAINYDLRGELNGQFLLLGWKIPATEFEELSLQTDQLSEMSS